jgi:hypothetical protein
MKFSDLVKKHRIPSNKGFEKSIIKEGEKKTQGE